MKNEIRKKRKSRSSHSSNSRRSVPRVIARGAIHLLIIKAQRKLKRIFMPKQKAIKWHKTSAANWISNSEKGYTGMIAFDGVSTYTLTVSPSAYTTTTSTLKNAKGVFRKYLHDKS